VNDRLAAGSSGLLHELPWRQLGPFRGGRVVAVAGDPVRPGTFYFGGAAGGVFKSDDGGASWANVSDGFFRAASVGALAVAESEPSVVYAGMGEACIRGNVVAGDGVWRSPDGGATWEHRGLGDTQHIARVRVHPHHADWVYAAVFGHVYGRHPDRGIYVSRDGGRNWTKTLYRDDHTGAADLAMDPLRPNILYASLWDAHRTPWSLVSGGPGSGLFKSVDGGETWTELTNRPGLPRGLKGRIGVAVHPGSDVVWAMVEAEVGGLFRSDDGGGHFIQVSDNPDLKQRPWYYMHVFADPVDVDTVYVLNLRMWRSKDGGRTFTNIPTPHGDNHDLWVDPKVSGRWIEGNDGGASVTFNGGRTWTLPYNQPTGQFYHVTTDREYPFRLYGAQQDNSTISLPIFSDKGSITAGDTYPVGGGESGYIAVRPDNPNIVFAGNYASRLTRYDHRSRQQVDITVWPEDPIGYGAGDLRYRFQWTFPVMLSPHDPDCLYTCGNHVFRSFDGGQHWEVRSPDLTRGDPETLRSSGGPITKDNVSTEFYGTIFAFAESPVTPGVLWAGSDDGLVHVSRDSGDSWTNVTPPDLPEWALISIIEPSPHREGTAYVVATRYKLDDRNPYVYRTDNFGASWSLAVNGIADDDFTRVVREDPKVADLLYLGTESGLYVSHNGGRRWSRLGGRLPVAPVHDLAVNGDTLVVATHGRGFWAVDDLSPIRETGGRSPDGLMLFTPPPVVRRRLGREMPQDPSPYHTYRQAEGEMVMGLGTADGFRPAAAGENPPFGAVLTYWLPPADAVDAEGLPVRVELRVHAEDGTLLREAASDDGTPFGRALTPRPGMNHVVWDLRVARGVDLPGALLSGYWGGSTVGPKVPPGRYRVDLTVGSRTVAAPLTVVLDPRVPASQEDLEAQYQLLIKIRDKLSEIHTAVLRSRAVRAELTQAAVRLRRAGHEALGAEAADLAARILAVEGELHQGRSRGRADSFNYPPKVNSKLASLESTTAFGESRPPQQCYDVYDKLAGIADHHLAEMAALLDDDTAAFSARLAAVALPLGF
jgi:photosystem II stability/assembly factor-like uncharacterized protein